MTDRQHHLMLQLQAFLRRDRPDAPALSDRDVEQAAKALAETYETATRGIIYEHSAGLPSAERLGHELKSLVDAEQKQGLRIGDAEISQVLRRIEGAARDAHTVLPGEHHAYLELLRRVLRDAPDEGSEPTPGPSSPGGPGPGGGGLIVPGR